MERIHECELVIEVDGDIHNDEIASQYDLSRTEVCRGANRTGRIIFLRGQGANQNSIDLYPLLQQPASDLLIQLLL